jgi:hypothetical protein
MSLSPSTITSQTTDEELTKLKSQFDIFIQQYKINYANTINNPNNVEYAKTLQTTKNNLEQVNQKLFKLIKTNEANIHEMNAANSILDKTIAVNKGKNAVLQKKLNGLTSSPDDTIKASSLLMKDISDEYNKGYHFIIILAVGIFVIFSLLIGVFVTMSYRYRSKSYVPPYSRYSKVSNIILELAC